MPVTREIPAPRHELDIAGDYAQAVGALAELGWTEPEAAGVPAVESIEAGISAIFKLSSWLIERAAQGANDQLVIAHTVGGKQGIGVANTIQRFDPKAFSDGYVWSSLWGQADGSANPYKGGDKGVIHDNAGKAGLKGAWDVAILLGDQIDPVSSKPTYAEGLVYTGKNVAEQRVALKAEQATLTPEIVSAGVGHIVADAAGLRLAGQDQRSGVTRLIHYPNQKVDGFDNVPNVNRNDRRLRFYSSNVGNDWSSNGARRLVRVPLPSLEA